MEKFVFNNESVKNSHGFYLLNAGGKFERFNNNPVMLHNHNPDKVLGKWLELEISGSLLTAMPEFDKEDLDAAKVMGQVERGYVKGASPGIIVLSAEWRENAATKEYELYVTSWELIEGTVTPMPSNAGALQLKVYDSQHREVSEEKILCHLEEIVKLSLQQNPNKKYMEKTEIKLSAEALVVLGLSDTANDSAVNSAIVNLHAEREALKMQNQTLQTENNAHKKDVAEQMVELAIKEQRITAANKQKFVDLALKDAQLCKETLEAIPARVALSSRVTKIGSGDIPAERKGWTFLQWMKNDMTGLNKLKIDSPEVYEQIKTQK